MYCWQVASPGVYGSIISSPPQSRFRLNLALTAFGNPGVYSSIIPSPPLDLSLIRFEVVLLHISSACPPDLNCLYNETINRGL